MARAGETIENPITGEQATVLVTAQETGGELSRMRFTLPRHRQGPVLHLHTTFEECFEVLDGHLSMVLGDPKHPRVLGPGETALVPRHTVHRFWNDSDEEAAFTIETRPARHLEEALQAAFGLARDGKTNKAGVPSNLWELALIFELSESYLPGLAVPIQKGIFGTLAWMAKRLGYDPEFRQYTRVTS